MEEHNWNENGICIKCGYSKLNPPDICPNNWDPQKVANLRAKWLGEILEQARKGHL